MDTKGLSVEQDNVTEDVMDGQDINTVAEAIDRPVTETKKDSYIYKAPDKRTIALVMVLSFVIPVIIMALAFVKVRIYPGGTFTLLTYDMSAQFMPTYASLRYIGNSDNSLFLSFSGALANNAWANYSTYIVNPGSWLSVFVPLSKLPDYLYLVALFRIGTCGLAFSTYLFFGKKRYRDRRYPMAVLLLSCCYALMSFNIMYFICLNWLVIVTMLPIVLIGIERILEGDRGLLFILSFTYSIFNSFQLSYMMGIFLILYILFRMIEEGRLCFGKIIRFFMCCACSLGLTMSVFLPMMYASQSGRSEMDYRSGKATYFSILELLKQFTSCQYDTIETGGLPYVFCGTVTLALVLLFFVKIKKNVRIRVAALCIIAIYLCSFCIVPINRIWHGFSETLSFPGRYAYTLCCFLLILAYEAIPDIFAFIKAPQNILRFAGILLLIAVFGELYMNAGYVMASFNMENPYMSKLEYTRYVENVGEMINSIPETDEFYRIGRDSTLTHNDGMLFGYNGICYFSSFHSRQMMEFLGRLGYSHVNHVLFDYGATPVTDSLLGIKYKIVRVAQNGNGYNLLKKNNVFGLYENLYSLPLGFKVRIKGDVDETAKILAARAEEGDAFACQELIMNDITDQDCNLYDYIEYDIEELEDGKNARHVMIRFTATDDSPIWIYSPNTVEGKVKIDDETEEKSGAEDVGIGTMIVNGQEVMPIRDEYSTLCTYMGTFKEGELVEAEVSSKVDFADPWIVKFDQNNFEKAVELIRNRQFIVSEHKNGRIIGQLDVKNNDEMLVLTLPDMEGYRVLVDGVETDYGAFRNAFLAIKLAEGTHNIEISYYPPGFKAGLITGAVSLVLSALILLIPTRKKEDETVDMQQS